MRIAYGPLAIDAAPADILAIGQALASVCGPIIGALQASAHETERELAASHAVYTLPPSYQDRGAMLPRARR